MASQRSARVQLDERVSAAASRLLATFAELPSTPDTIATTAAGAARDLALEIPLPPGVLIGIPPAHARDQAPTLEADRTVVVRSAGLLQALAGMPSTPPDLRDEAGAMAEALWDVLAEEPDGGHRGHQRRGNG